MTDDSRGEAGLAQTVAIRAGGLATSSTTARRWRSRDGAVAWLEARAPPARLVRRDGSVVLAAGWPG